MTTPQKEDVPGETVWTMKVDELLEEITKMKKEMGMYDHTSEG